MAIEPSVAFAHHHRQVPLSSITIRGGIDLGNDRRPGNGNGGTDLPFNNVTPCGGRSSVGVVIPTSISAEFDRIPALGLGCYRVIGLPGIEGIVSCFRKPQGAIGPGPAGIGVITIREAGPNIRTVGMADSHQ